MQAIGRIHGYRSLPLNSECALSLDGTIFILMMYPSAIFTEHLFSLI